MAMALIDTSGRIMLVFNDALIGRPSGRTTGSATAARRRCSSTRPRRRSTRPSLHAIER